MSQLTAMAARYDVPRVDAEGFDIEEPGLRLAVICALASRTDELFATVERLAPVKDHNVFTGEYKAAEVALRFALVDLDALKPTLGELSSAGEKREAASRAA